MSEAPEPAAPDSRLGHTTGVVLRAARRGAADLRLGEHTLAERAALLLAEICERVTEIDAPSGEIEAVVAALEAADTDHVLVVSADRPLLAPDLLIGLAGLPDADAAIPHDGDGPHATCGRYRRASALPALQAAAAAGEASIAAALARCEVVWLEGESLAALDPEGAALSRIADASGLARLAAMHPEHVSGPWPGAPGLGLTASREGGA